MKKLFFLLVLTVYMNIAALPSDICTIKSNDPQYTITITDCPSETIYLYLSRRASGKWINLDSTLMGNIKTITFKGNLNAPEVLFLRQENSDKTISFFAENSDISIQPDFEKPENSIINGSSTHNEYSGYLDLFKDLNSQKEILYKNYQQAKAEKNNLRMEQIVAGFDSLAELEMNRNKNYVAENTSSWVSPYVIRKSMYYSLSLDELKEVVNSLNKNLDVSVYVKELNNHIMVLEKVAPGKQYTDFSLPSPDGQMLALSDLVEGKYILIDFWASWCGPCRRENPNVVKMYNQYKNKGFEILGVSFDTKRDNWLKAIQDDSLTWHHVSDLQGWGSAAGKLYGVNSIPHTVLIGPDKKIIEKNLRGEALERKLKELLD